MAEVIWTEPALSDLDTLADYIALDKPDAASRLVQRVLQHVEMLGSQPALGSRIPELLGDPRYRQIVEPPGRIFYRHSSADERVFILGVMRGEPRFRMGKLSERDSKR